MDPQQHQVALPANPPQPDPSPAPPGPTPPAETLVPSPKKRVSPGASESSSESKVKTKKGIHPPKRNKASVEQEPNTEAGTPAPVQEVDGAPTVLHSSTAFGTAEHGARVVSVGKHKAKRLFEVYACKLNPVPGGYMADSALTPVYENANLKRWTTEASSITTADSRNQFSQRVSIPPKTGPRTAERFLPLVAHVGYASLTIYSGEYYALVGKRLLRGGSSYTVAADSAVLLGRSPAPKPVAVKAEKGRYLIAE